MYFAQVAKIGFFFSDQIKSNFQAIRGHFRWRSRHCYNYITPVINLRFYFPEFEGNTTLLADVTETSRSKLSTRIR